MNRAYVDPAESLDEHACAEFLYGVYNIHGISLIKNFMIQVKQQ